MKRVAIQIRGIVQGVGFRPHVYTLADELELAGWVLNSSDGVQIEIEGQEASVTAFIERLRSSSPVHARITEFDTEEIRPFGEVGFRIRRSTGAGSAGALVLPDLATCDDCRRELFDPEDRRYRYPFTNCTNCGPRFSIIESIPYDRQATTMKGFEMCGRCRAEYEDPTDRRFHAQPNACPECGPQLTLRSGEAQPIARGDDALKQAADAVRAGKVVGVKGLGGFHLMVDATNDEAVARLRERKRRPSKPLAVMFPNLETVERVCQLEDAERAALVSAKAPIVLLRKRTGSLSPGLAPDNPHLGAFLPYTPLHMLLLDDLGSPVVATSGNLSDEPICIDGDDAIERLGHIADLFLDHDRPIRRPVEDSVVAMFRGEEGVVRRGRGYAPAPVATVGGPSLTAVGGDLKSAASLIYDGHVILGGHVGDLGDVRGRDALEERLDDLVALYQLDSEVVACDAHPDYVSTRLAEARQKPLHRVQHHHAHVASVMAEHDLAGPVLGIAWDGTGWGSDETVWGGEFLVVDRQGFERIGHLRCFDLPGGDAVAREPRRSALALLHAAGLDVRAVEGLFHDEELAVLRSMLERKVRTVRSSSAGRLFDGVACLLGVGPPRTTFEAEAAMALEFSAARAAHAAALTPMTPVNGVLDWRPTVSDLVRRAPDEDPDPLARAFHAALADGIVSIARWANTRDCVLAGGCFQNRVLLDHTVRRLENDGFRPHWSQQIPSGDGGLAAGQAAVAAWRFTSSEERVR